MRVCELRMYMDSSEETTDKIQIVTEGQVWEHATEVYADSGLLDLIDDWEVYAVESVLSTDKKPILRIGVEEVHYGRKMQIV